MRAVADAGPLIHLSWIDQLHLVNLLFDEVFVPPAVRDEVLAAPTDTPGLQTIQLALRSGSLTLKAPRSNKPPSEATLGAGEGQAILLTAELQPCLLLTDDARARAMAVQRGLSVVGTIGVLAQARDQGHISATLPLVLELRRLGQWISDELLALLEAEETSGP